MIIKKPCTMQHDASDCGATAISIILLTYKQEMSIMKIREIIGTDLYGTSVKGVDIGWSWNPFDFRLDYSIC